MEDFVMIPVNEKLLQVWRGVDDFFLVQFWTHSLCFLKVAVADYEKLNEFAEAAIIVRKGKNSWKSKF